MTVQKITTMCLATCVLLASQTLALAGGCETCDDCSTCYTHSDMQFFSPVNFDFDCYPMRKECGLFFRYDKLNWAITGDRVAVGNPNVQVLSEAVFPGNVGIDQGLPPAQYAIINGLQDVPPTANFGWGERYELGKFNKSSGWSIGILDGPEVNTSFTIGNGPEQSGFGSVHVNFATPEGFLLGIRDYQTQTINGEGLVTAQNPTTNGPGGTADGLSDDINGNSIPVFFFFGVDADANGTLDDDEVTGNGLDFGDLHLFNITFDQVSIRNTTETHGIEIMKTHRLSNGHRLEKKRNRHFDFGYGVRFLRIRDQFSFSGTSPLMGTMQFTTEAENQLVGPQIRGQWTHQRGRWGLNLDGRCMLAYNITDADQVGSYGLDNTDALGVVINPGLEPGALNRPLVAQPNAFSYGRQDNEFSPTVEIRAEMSYQFTSAIAARMGYTGIFVDNISRGAAITNYSLPDFGFLQGGQQDIFINGANIGFDVVY